MRTEATPTEPFDERLERGVRYYVDRRLSQRAAADVAGVCRNALRRTLRARGLSRCKSEACRLSYRAGRLDRSKVFWDRTTEAGRIWTAGPYVSVQDAAKALGTTWNNADLHVRAYCERFEVPYQTSEARLERRVRNLAVLRVRGASRELCIELMGLTSGQADWSWRTARQRGLDAEIDTREERADCARALAHLGHAAPQVAEALGLTVSAVNAYLND